ncbi:hypothetical protein GCM10010992_21690 [Cloacibacterium rupense]|uniref:Uncharacterized protein n=1 Tax=Cloacibacterium rupense TaxID=517423 RepID=A0ABQ2NKA8_9FLAO|nr:DUF6427 family protein [Cloacibacterium rupense]GGP05472.1 hypothetical protein GCM10010992_21690 [Cloacibacterium rupense]
MFRLLSKETNIFSIPVYIFLLFLLIVYFNVLDFRKLELITDILTFCGFALGYFLFSAIGLNYNTHLPLVLYSISLFSLYPGNLDIGIGMSVFTNSFVIFLLASDNDHVRKNSYLIIGSILTINFIFLPTTWPMFIFVFIHLISTADRILLNIFRYFYGILMVLGTYFGIMYLLGNTEFDERYLPLVLDKFSTDFYPLYLLAPIALFVLYAISDHFANFNKKSPRSKYQYSFLLFFFIAQLTTVFLYMGNSYEYLLLLVLPNVIIIARGLRFLRKYWMKELGFWVIIFSLLAYKAATFF